MKARILVAGMALFLAACAVQEFPNERKVDVAAGVVSL